MEPYENLLGFLAPALRDRPYPRSTTSHPTTLWDYVSPGDAVTSAVRAGAAYAGREGVKAVKNWLLGASEQKGFGRPYPPGAYEALRRFSVSRRRKVRPGLRLRRGIRRGRSKIPSYRRRRVGFRRSAFGYRRRTFGYRKRPSYSSFRRVRFRRFS